MGERGRDGNTQRQRVGIMTKTTLAVVTWVAVAVMCGAVVSCSSSELPERQPVQYEDFGHEVYRMLYREMRISSHYPDAKMAVLAESKDDVIWALNRMVDDPVYDSLQGVLEAILPRYEYTRTSTPCVDDSVCTGEGQYCLTEEGVCVDAGVIPRISRRLQEILSKMDQPQFDALAKFAASTGAPPDAMNRLIYRVLVYDRDLFPPLHTLVVEQEPILTEILRWGHRKILDLEDSDPPEHPTFAEKLLAEVDAGLDTGSPSWAIVLDENGNPVVNTENGEPIPPYQDTDGDGVVDTDAAGNPINAQGDPIVLPVFSDQSYQGETRDQDGRALAPTQPVFEYFDVKKTLLGALLWNLHPMVEDNLIWNLFTAFEGLLGAKVNRQDEDGEYPGFDGDSNPILDLLYAFREVRSYERLPQVMQILKALVQQNPLLMKQVLTELGKTISIFEGPDRLTPNNTLFDDLHVELEYLSKHGLLKELLLAFLDPRIDVLPQGLLNMMNYTDIDVADPNDDLSCSSLSACQDRIQEIYTLGYAGMTDWTKSDDQLENQSIQQKFMALVWDTYEEPDFVSILGFGTNLQLTDDMARFYAESMAGVAELNAGSIDGSLVVGLIPEFEDKYPSAEEVGLFMNHDHASSWGNAVCKQGYDVKDHLGRYLLALQTTTALDGFKPIAEGFANLDELPAFTRLLTVLHFHYGSTKVEDPNGITTQYGTNFRALEQPMVRMLSETTFLPRTIDLVRALADLEVTYNGETLDPIDELDRFLGYMLDTSGQNGVLTTYAGDTWIYGGDGVRRIENLSRVYLLLHAFDRMDDALESSPTAKAAWDNIDLIGYFLDVDPNTGALKNPTTVPLVLNLVPILADEVTTSFQKPTYLSDLDEELADMEEFFSSRGFSYLYDLMLAIRDDPKHADLKSLLDDLLLKMTDISRTGDNDLFGALLAVMSDLIQSRIDCNAGKQLLRWFGEVIEPGDRILFELVDLVAYVYNDDPDHVFVELMKNLFREQTPGRFAINVLARVIKSIHRYDPTQRGAYTAQDFEHIITALADYLVDKERGLERMYHIINNRK